MFKGLHAAFVFVGCPDGSDSGAVLSGAATITAGGVEVNASTLTEMIGLVTEGARSFLLIKLVSVNVTVCGIACLT